MQGVFARGAVFGVGLFASVWFANAIWAADVPNQTGQTVPSHPIVPGFERFVGTNSATTLHPGRLLLGELNCASCHQAPKTASKLIQTKQAPILDDVGTRVRVEYLREFLNDPGHVKPGTTMPNLFANLTEVKRQRQVEALVHFLAMTGSVNDKPADSKKIRKGEKLFHEVGCTACHAPRNGTALKDAVSVPLGKLSQKYTVPSLMQFLLDPLKVRPSARMPAPNLSKNETEEIVSYLLGDLVGFVTPEIANLPKIPYRYYEGSWSNLPDFDMLKPKTAKQGPAFSTSVTERDNNFGLVFDAWFLVPTTGDYTFEITSDDGSELLVDQKRVVLNDGSHPAQSRQGKTHLGKGPHQVTVRFFQAGGPFELQVKIGGPGLPLQPMGPLVAASQEELLKKAETKPEEDKEKPQFVIDPQLVKQGRELFGTLGCASCHKLKENNQPIQTAAATRQLAKPLQELTGTGGCLAGTAQSRAPFFSLSETQREAISNALAELRTAPNEQPKPETQIAATMLRFNCYACHERDKIGGVPQARNELFQTTQKEMGDEGRIPPALDGVGAKLTTNWLKKIFAEGSADRPYMLTRMPKFGGQNLGHLQALVENLDTIEPVEIPTIDMPLRRIKSIGRSMCGDEVFGCIKCHTFKGERALGVQSIDMTIMTKRLKHDWFHRYLVKPSAFRPGTRMPTAWPQGRSTLRDVLDSDPHKQIEAIWLYLSDGAGARPPQGLNRRAIVLAADKNAVIYRNFIQGAGPRAIGVAYPEKVNLAFDANEMRLALIWQNKFIDASKHWVGRGPGFQVPLGDQVLKLSDGPAFARLDSPDATWPTQPAKEMGYKFRGYRLTKDNRPTFLYDFDNVTIEDFPTGEATEPFLTLKRTLILKQNQNSSDPQRLYFRAAAGSKIEEISSRTYRINEDYQVRIPSNDEPIIVKINGHQELRVPIHWNKGQAKIVQEIVW